MKKLIFIVFLLFPLIFAAKEKYRQSDLHAGNFYLQNKKIQFEKRLPTTLSMQALEKRLKSFNDPSSGMQVKSLRPDGMNGTMIRYQLDWTTSGFRSRKIPKFLKQPVNATFEVKKEAGGYLVRITNIWFNNTINPGNQQHITLEDMTLRKNGFAFTRKKKVLRALSVMDENLSLMFSADNSF